MDQPLLKEKIKELQLLINKKSIEYYESIRDGKTFEEVYDLRMEIKDLEKQLQDCMNQSQS